MNKIFHASLIAIAVAASSLAYATEPQSIALTNNIRFIPELSVDLRHDDNFREIERNRDSSWITNIRPTFTLDAFSNKAQYQLSYSLDREIVHSYSKDSNTDHFLDGKAGFEFNARNKLVLDAGYSKIRNTTSKVWSSTPADNHDEGDKYTIRHAGGIYTFGADSARIQIELGANHARLRYDNSGHLNQDRDLDTTRLHSTLYYRVTPRTRILGEVRHTDYDYKSNKTLDAKNNALLAGAVWEATAKTTGTVKVGREKKRFNKNIEKDQSGSIWEVAVNYAPLTYSTFELTTGRAFIEGEDEASAVRRTHAGLSWKHYWLERFYSSTSYSYNKDKYFAGDRNDKLNDYSLGFTYELRRWLDLGLTYSHADNDSNVRGHNYKRNIYMLSVKASL